MTYKALKVFCLIPVSINKQHVAVELGIQRTENLKLSELQNAILTATNHEKEFVNEILNSVIEERKNKAKEEKEERKEEEI